MGILCFCLKKNKKQKNRWICCLGCCSVRDDVKHLFYVFDLSLSLGRLLFILKTPLPIYVPRDDNESTVTINK